MCSEERTCLLSASLSWHSSPINAVAAAAAPPGPRCQMRGLGGKANWAAPLHPNSAFLLNSC